MNFKVKNQKEEENQDIELWLEEGMKGEVLLMGKDSKKEKRILMMFNRGKFYRSMGRFYRNESTELQGLETDENGRIKEKE